MIFRFIFFSIPMHLINARFPTSTAEKELNSSMTLLVRHNRKKSEKL